MSWVDWKDIFGTSETTQPLSPYEQTAANVYTQAFGNGQYANPPTNTITTATSSTTLQSGLQNALNTTGYIQPPPFQRDFRQIQSQSDLDHAVFKTPIEDLVNMWIARYGTDWVDKEQVLGDEFFEWAALRLRSTGRLEEHTLWGGSVTPTSIGTVQARRTVLRVVDK